MNRFYESIKRVFGKIYVPYEVLSGKKHTRVLHISDTPAFIFPELKSLIRKVKPGVIIHTGDLVDNVKLGLYPNLLKDYKRQLNKMSKVLAEFPEIEVHVVVGNHDNPYLVRSILENARVYDHATDIVVAGIGIGISHYPPKLQSSLEADGSVNGDNQVRYYLYGHDRSLPSSTFEETIYLNGIEHIHLLDMDEEIIHRLQYPVGTDNSRQNRYKIGI